MDKLKMHSRDTVKDHIAQIAALFPNALTETLKDGKVLQAIDFDILKQELSDVVVDGQAERYQFTWPDKRKSIMLANAPIAKTLRPNREESVDFDTTENLYIEGDNLDALKLLQETYLGKIKMIYIDPPYNTGNDFIYDDDFAKSKEGYLPDSGQFNEEGGQLVANPESNGRFHTDWLNMIYPRLKLAKDLLTDDGVIFISIDDNEIENLKKVCNEIFGEDNFIDNIIWKKRYGGGAKEKYLVSVHEYILAYAKSINSLPELFVPYTEETIQRYYTQKDENFFKRGAFRTHPLEATKSMGERKNLVFPITAPDGTQVMPKRQWLWGRDRVEQAIKLGELAFIRDREGNWSVHSKQYLKDNDGVVRQGKAFSIIDDVYTQHGTNEFIELFGNAQIFPFPKPKGLYKSLLNLGTNEDAIVLDFFSGSATTAHALMQLNADDGGNRKFIMVQIPESTDENSEAYKAGYKNICEIGKERIRRAGKKIKSETKETAENLDIGFRVLKIDSTNMRDIYYTPGEYKQGILGELADNIKSDRTAEDLLVQVMLDLGILFSSKIKEMKVGGKKVFDVAEGYLLACFDQNVNSDVVTEIAKRKPYYAIFRDSGIASDSVATNFEQIFATYSPTTVRKVL